MQTRYNFVPLNIHMNVQFNDTIPAIGIFGATQFQTVGSKKPAKHVTYLSISRSVLKITLHLLVWGCLWIYFVENNFSSPPTAIFKTNASCVDPNMEVDLGWFISNQSRDKVKTKVENIHRVAGNNGRR